uniref:PDZK1-interacting protein 1 n=1 Tax=Anas platyrhynchos platyrhynchos TaxID=8840 RepID=U3HZ79_ANAPP
MCALSRLLEPLCLGKLQPWSQGVIAAVVFLVLVAIVFVVNRFWCNKKSAPAAHHLLGLPRHSLTQPRLWRRANSLCFSPHPRSKESTHAYENTLELEERVVTTAM